MTWLLIISLFQITSKNMSVLCGHIKLFDNKNNQKERTKETLETN